MKKESIKKVIESAVKFYDAINDFYGNERDAAIKKAFGDSFGYTDEEDEVYTINGVSFDTYSTPSSDITKTFFEAIGVDPKDRELFKAVTDYAIEEYKASPDTYNDGLKVLSLFTGFLVSEINGGVIFDEYEGKLRIITDGYSCYPPTYSYDEFINEFSR